MGGGEDYEVSKVSRARMDMCSIKGDEEGKEGVEGLTVQNPE